MNERLPVEIENLELPIDNKYNKTIINNNPKNVKRNTGFVSVMSLISLLITLGSILAIMFLGRW